MAESYTTLSLGFKTDINDKLSVGLFVNQPYGADAKYTAGFYNGLEAHWSSEQIAALIKYDVGSGVSVYGGAKYVTSEAQIAIPDRMIRASMLAAGGSAAALAGAAPAGTLGYTATTDKNSQAALIVGAAYEKPEIALRVALTYASETKHDLATSVGGSPVGSETVELPKSVTLDAQSGIAANTLLFGSVRWVDWTSTTLNSIGYPFAPLVSHDNDTITYTLGVGRKFTDNWSGAVSVGYEKPAGGLASNLAPTDGFLSLGVGGSYTQGNMKISGGVRYVKIGDADALEDHDVAQGAFRDNSAVGVGVKVGWTF